MVSYILRNTSESTSRCVIACEHLKIIILSFLLKYIIIKNTNIISLFYQYFLQYKLHCNFFLHILSRT